MTVGILFQSPSGDSFMLTPDWVGRKGEEAFQSPSGDSFMLTFFFKPFTVYIKLFQSPSGDSFMLTIS